MNFHPSVRERIFASLFHAYPLIDGFGSVASSRLAKTLVPTSKRTVWAKVGGRPCLVPLNDLVGRAIFLVGELDRKVGMTIRRYVRPGDITLDVGANLGLVSLQMANAGASRILAFEPNPSILTMLEATLSANSDANIELHCVALGRQEEELVLSIPEGNAGKATLLPDQDHSAAQVTVPVLRLNDVLEREDARNVNFMKIDVEGSEPSVLEGLFCGSTRPTYILFEDHKIGDSETARILRGEGYLLKGLSASKHFSLVEVPEGDPKFSHCHDFIAHLNIY